MCFGATFRAYHTNEMTILCGAILAKTEIRSQIRIAKLNEPVVMNIVFRVNVAHWVIIDRTHTLYVIHRWPRYKRFPRITNTLC